MLFLIYQQLEQGQIPVKENHLKSTNLSHLEAVIYTAESFGEVTSVLRPVHYIDEYGQESTLLLDVVGHGGRAWIKITARKAKALHRIWQGIKGVLHPRPFFRLFMHFSQKLQHIGNK